MGKGRPILPKEEKKIKLSVTISIKAYEYLEKNTSNKSAVVESLIIEKFKNE